MSRHVEERRCQDDPVDVREYRSDDLDACRGLYAQLVEHHREIYADPTIGGDDPARGFDDYLALPERVLTWVAADGDTIVGLTGLLWEGEESTIEPVIVDRRYRRTGVGRRLINIAVEESRRRGATDVTHLRSRPFTSSGSGRLVMSSSS